MRVVIADGGMLPSFWPFVRERLEQRVAEFAEPVYQDWLGQEPDLSDVAAIAWFGLALDPSVVARGSDLRVVGGVFDRTAAGLLEALAPRGIPLVDVTRAWAPSVAETGLALILCGLRRIAWWHHHVIRGDAQWPQSQFCDDPSMVNGELGTKVIGVVGLGAIGSRIASWCATLGARVLAHDPFVPAEEFPRWGAQAVGPDEIVDAADVLVIAVPPTPSAAGLIDAPRIARLRRGAWVVSVTRTAALDTQALRARVLAGELGWASDVWDVEPLPHDDPLIGRDNVVHLPHIAGRTKDANQRVADLLADDFQAVLEGREPACALTVEQVRIRVGA